MTSMNRPTYFRPIFLAINLAFSLLLLLSCSDEISQPLIIGTGGPGSTYDDVGRAIARIVNNSQGQSSFRLEERFSAGSSANIEAIVAGKVSFGIAQADRAYQAFTGIATWKEKGRQEDLRALFSLYTESVTLVARNGSGIDTIHDLKGKRVDIGLVGSGTRQNATDALEAASIDWRNDLELYSADLDNQLSMLMQDKLDAFFYTVGHPNQNIKLATFSVRGVHFIPLTNIETLLSKSRYYSRSFIPVKLYPQVANDSNVETIGVKAVLLTSVQEPDDVVYTVTKSVFENIAALGEYDDVLKTIKKEGMLDGLTVPLHPGALRYYREIGVKVP